MKTTYIPLLIIAGILAAATWTARITTQPASAIAQAPRHSRAAARKPDLISRRVPMEVARAIHAARALARDPADIGAYLMEPRRADTLQLLSAVDDVVAADVSLHDRVREKHGVSLPESWDLRVIQDNLGLFSTNVSFIGESIKGDSATVTVQEGGHVPLVHAKFIRVDGQWLHEPETVETGVCEALGRLAETIRDVERSVEEGAPFESLDDAFTFRILPRIHDVARAGESGRAE